MEQCSPQLSPASRESSTAPIRVAIVAPSLRQVVGGQEVQASILLSRWASDHAVMATFVPTVPLFPAVLEWVNKVRFLRTVVRFPKYVFDLMNSIRRVDLVHVFSASFTSFLMATLPAWLAARVLAKPILINYHSGRGPQHLARSRLARFVLRHSTAVVVPSQYLVEAFAAHSISATEISNVTDNIEFSYRSRNPFRPWLICTRNFAPYYGIDVVLRAFSRVQKEFADAQLCLVGTGTCESELHRLAARLNVKRVEFVGCAPPQIMPSLYGRNDIFINGSCIDNAPCSIVEAFCCGLPVISTDAGGIPHLVQHEVTGLLSPSGDWSALAENVIRLLKNQGLAKAMAENGLKTAQRHSWTKVRADWLTLYRSL